MKDANAPKKQDVQANLVLPFSCSEPWEASVETG